jgi:hypothetical protein
VLTLPVGSKGLTVKGMVLLSQHDKSIAGAAESDDYFGASIAGGDVTQDGIADVLVGVPGEDTGTAKDAGTAVLLRGSRKGLTGVRSQTLAPSPGGPERDDAFGSAVAVLNLNGANGLDAVVGAPGERVAGDDRNYGSGTVTKLFGGGNGLGGGVSVSGRALGVGGLYYGYLAHQ